MMHGFSLAGVPSEEEDPDVDGYAEQFFWTLWETQDEGITSPSASFQDWRGNYVRDDEFIPFKFSDDMVDLTQLHGIAVFLLPPDGVSKKGLIRDKEIEGPFFITGLIDGEPVCFHTSELACQILKWFTKKQAVWYAYYKYDLQTEEDPQEEGEAQAGRPPSRRGPTIH